MMLFIFNTANLIVLMFCIWITLSDEIVTGISGTLGFSIVGLSAAMNFFKAMHHFEKVDAPETGLLVGLSIVCVWIVARVFYWHRKGGHRGAH